MIKLESGAWPKGKKIPYRSNVHEKIASLNLPIHKEDLEFRPMTMSDIPEFRNLEAEWFPFEYSTAFYNRINDTKNVIAMGCFWTPPNISESFLLGGVMAQYESSSSAFWYVSDTEVSRNFSCCTQLKNYFRNWSNLNLYIITIGVIDEARRLGIASWFINYLFDKGNSIENCVSISLHVMEENIAAINCYEKLGFIHVHDKNDYYYFMNEIHNGRYYVKKLHEDNNVTIELLK